MSDKGSNIKSRLPSRHVSVGPKSAPHRSMYYAMGMTEEQIYQPFVGVATTWNESAPCNITLGRQAQAVKKGVKEVNGTPREFTTITVTDGIAMGHEAMKASLVSREVIADSVELSVRGHCYDGIVGLAGCDKSLPGLMMAMVRLNIPSVFIYGGSILPGNYKGKDLTIIDVFEAVGKHASGEIDEKELKNIEKEIIKLEDKKNTYNEKLKSILGKLNNKAFIEKAPDNVIENFRIQEQDMKSSIEKINEIINTIY